MENKTVEEIIKEYLTKNEFHGLYNSDVDCTCKRNDIAPCGGIGMHCRAGYLQPLEDDSEYDFVIGRVNHGCTESTESTETKQRVEKVLEFWREHRHDLRTEKKVTSKAY